MKIQHPYRQLASSCWTPEASSTRTVNLSGRRREDEGQEGHLDRKKTSKERAATPYSEENREWFWCIPKPKRKGERGENQLHGEGSRSYAWSSEGGEAHLDPKG